MTTKDYKLLAQALKDMALPGLTSDEGLGVIVETLCGALLRDNPHFDRKKFLRAAGLITKEQATFL